MNIHSKNPYVFSATEEWITNCYWCPSKASQMSGNKSQRKNPDQIENGTVEISQNTSKSPPELRKLAITQILVKKTLF